VLALLSPSLPAQEPPEFIPYRQGNKWGYCNNQKQMVIPVKYDWADNFSDGLAYFVINRQTGDIDIRGTEYRKDWPFSCTE